MMISVTAWLFAACLGFGMPDAHATTPTAKPAVSASIAVPSSARAGGGRVSYVGVTTPSARPEPPTSLRADQVLRAGDRRFGIVQFTPRTCCGVCVRCCTTKPSTPEPAPIGPVRSWERPSIHDESGHRGVRLGSVMPRVGAVSPNVGPVVPRVGAVSPRVRAVSPRVGAVSPRLGSVRPVLGPR